jgi:hypothetical protein
MMLPSRYASTMVRCLKRGKYVSYAVLVSYVADAVTRCGGCASARMVAESLASEEGAEHRFEQGSNIEDSTWYTQGPGVRRPVC